MGEMSAAGDRDPYMQAYITARMKNQVEEMKLQKLLSSMEMSQRLRKIMINLELFEDRRQAHLLQHEVTQMAKRRKMARAQFLRQQASRQLTAAWTSSLAPPDPDPALHHATTIADVVTHHHSAPHPAPYPAPPGPSQKGVYLSTKGREGQWRGGAPGRGDEAQQDSKEFQNAAEGSNIPVIRITDLSQDDVLPAAGEHGREPCRRPVTTSENRTQDSSGILTATLDPAPGASTNKMVYVTTPTPLSAPQGGRSAPQPYLEQCREASPPSGEVHLPQVCRPRRPAWSRSSPASRERRRLASASHFWPGDPRAIHSVRRDRRNVKEMMASMKAGEETRRLLREVTPTCSRNCSQPDLLSQLGRTYVNLPDLLPEIEKARQRLAEEEGEEVPFCSVQQQERSEVTLSGKRRVMGRFEVEEDVQDVASTKNLPLYHIDYSSLRQIGGTRRNSVLC